jgi:predicted nucleic acid-binding protein
MSGDFLDSNVILYLFDATDAGKRNAATTLVESALSDGSGYISYQVVQEVLNVITRRFDPPASARDARVFLDAVLVPLWRVMPSQELYHRGLDLYDRYGYSFYDSLIIAAALQSGCTRLYSEDLQGGPRFDQLVIEDPFA